MTLRLIKVVGGLVDYRVISLELDNLTFKC